MTARRVVWPAAFLLSAAVSLGVGCSRPEPLPVLGAVPPFQLTAQDGTVFSSAKLNGHVWIADFIYTNCPGPCPLMSRRMKRAEQATGAGVQLVSFSVDPARDTPPVLAAYAKRYGASPARWHFLTGDAKTLEMLDRDAFKLGNLTPSFDHSTRFVLVDQQSRIRGYYGMGMDGMLERMVRDAKNVEGEKS